MRWLPKSFNATSTTNHNWLLWLLVLGIPLGAGAQNVILAIACFALFLMHRSFFCSQISDGPIKTHAILGITFIAWLALATLFNANNAGNRMLSFLLGYAPFILLPAVGLPRLRLSSKLIATFVVVIAVIALICWSQYVWGWKRVGLTIVDAEFRGRGTWTHPLTLAYAALLFLPFSVGWVLFNPRAHFAWVFLIAECMIIWTTRSRVVILVSIVITMLQFFITAPRRLRLRLAAGLLVVVAVTAFTDNTISNHFRDTLAGKVDRHTTQYPDDRVVFWHAYLHLAAERPLLGHGIHIPKSTRNAAYDAIGMDAFPKKYSAHNQYLQLLAEGGLAGLILFSCLFIFWWRVAWRHRHHPVAMSLALSLCGFALAIFTQNAFQDNEVRYVLTLVLMLSGTALTSSALDAESA